MINRHVVSGSVVMVEARNVPTWFTCSISDMDLIGSYHWRYFGESIITVAPSSATVLRLDCLLLNVDNSLRVFNLNNNPLDYTRENLTLTSTTLRNHIERIDDTVSHLHMTRGYTAIIDTEDIGIIAPYIWIPQKPKQMGIYIRTNFTQDNVRHTYSLPKYILGLEDKGPGITIQFRNGNRMDCRKENLDVHIPN